MDIIQDLSIEGLTVGYIYKNPNTLNEYLDLIIPDYDFSDDGLKFLYKLLIDTYLTSDLVNETSLNIQASKLDSQSKKLYKNLGGFKTYQRLGVISDVYNDFKPIYEKLKTYNILRHLDKKGFSVKPNIDKLKDKTVDEILKAYESQLLKVSSYIKNIHDTVRLGHDIVEVYEQLKNEPDVGIELPFPIINQLARGWRTGKLYASAFHSGFGKSREIAYILCHVGIVNQIPVFYGINEQEKLEIDLMILTCISNMVFSKKYGIEVEETEIALGLCTGEKDKMVREAAEYIKARSKIEFMELDAWDLDSIKIMLKRQKLKGINFAVVDTFKAMRGIGNQGMSDWMQFSYTAEQLKKLIGSEKSGGLNMGLWLTLQMTDESLITKVMGSSSIASSRHVKHHLDFLKFSRMLDNKDKEKYSVKYNNPGNPFHGLVQPLDYKKTYYLSVVDKNRGGLSPSSIIYEVNKGKMQWKEVGKAVIK